MPPRRSGMHNNVNRIIGVSCLRVWCSYLIPFKKYKLISPSRQKDCVIPYNPQQLKISSTMYIYIHIPKYTYILNAYLCMYFYNYKCTHIHIYVKETKEVWKIIYLLNGFKRGMQCPSSPLLCQNNKKTRNVTLIYYRWAVTRGVIN